MSPLRLAAPAKLRRAERGEAGEAAAEQARLGEERRAGVARRRRRGLAQRAVGVEGLEVEAHGRLLHAMNPVAATAFGDLLAGLGRVQRGRRGALAGDVPDPGRVARLDRHDRRGRRQRLAAQPRALAVVGGDARVLEHDRGRRELRRVRRGALEVERRLGDRGAAERLLEVVDMRELVVAHGGGERQQLAGERTAGHRLHVELRLEVLEQQREVEDLAVLPLRRPPERELRQSTDQQPAGGDRAAADHRPAQHLRAGRPAVLVERLAQRALRVVHLERQWLGHPLPPVVV